MGGFIEGGKTSLRVAKSSLRVAKTSLRVAKTCLRGSCKQAGKQDGAPCVDQAHVALFVCISCADIRDADE